MTYLAGNLKVDSFPRLSDMAKDADAPRDLDLVVASGSVQEETTGARMNVEELRHQGLLAPGTLDQEEGGAVRVQENGEVVHRLLGEALEVEVRGYVPNHAQEELPLALRPEQLSLGSSACRRPARGQLHLRLDQQRQHVYRIRWKRTVPGKKNNIMYTLVAIDRKEQ